MREKPEKELPAEAVRRIFFLDHLPIGSLRYREAMVFAKENKARIVP
jgi:hypothetical protein